MNIIKERILTIFNTSKKRRLAVIAAVMVILCIFAGLAAVNIFSFKTESSAYKDALARIDAITVNGKIAVINGGLPARLFDIIYSEKPEGDIDTENAYKLISVICARTESSSVYSLAQFFSGRDAAAGAGLYEYMVENMPEESARYFTDSVITLYAMDENMDLLWHAAAVDAVPRFDPGTDDFTISVYNWDEAAQSKLENIDPYRVVYINFAEYLKEYKDETVNLTGCDGNSLYFRGTKVGQIGSARYVKFDYDNTDPEVFDIIFGGIHTPADMSYELKDGYSVSTSVNETGGLDVLYDVSPGILVPVSWSPDFKDAVRASQLIFFNTAPKIKADPSAAGFDLSPYATGFGKEYGAVTTAYIIDLICNYSQYGDNSAVVTNSIILPRLTDGTDTANDLNERIVSDFMSLYGMYLPYLVTGDTDYAPVYLICDYSYEEVNGIGSIVVKTSCFDFITEQTITRYAFYYINETEKIEATLADFLDACQQNAGEAYFKIGSDPDAVAVQLNSEQVRFANSGEFTGALDGHSITADEITGVFRRDRTGPFRAVAEVGGKQYCFELPAGTDHSWDYYFMFDNTKSLRGDNLGAYIFIREKTKYIIKCDGKIPDLLWIGEDKIAFTQQISRASCRIAVAELTKEGFTNEYILYSDDISAKFRINIEEYAPKEFNILYFSPSPDGEALICRYFLILEKGFPAANEINEEYPAAAVQIYSETCEGYVRADLITGELTFIDAQTTEIPTEFKEVTILPVEISENGFADDPETTAIDNAAVTLTIPVTWETYNGFLFDDSTRTEEKGYLYNKRFEGCYQLIRVGEDFIWDSDINLRASEQYGEKHASCFGYGKG
ncbi:MAG: hypothetical protein ACYC00_19675, partial [Eubacteriales bacterium]